MLQICSILFNLEKKKHVQIIEDIHNEPDELWKLSIKNDNNKPSNIQKIQKTKYKLKQRNTYLL